MNIPADSSIKLKIVYEDENLVVIDKPAGLLTHPISKKRSNFHPSVGEQISQEKTLTDFLSNRYPEIKKVGDEPELRPGLVHRLDKDTSGLMVIARNQEAFNFFKKQFSAPAKKYNRESAEVFGKNEQEQKVEKRYLALVYGQILKDEGQIILPIGKSKKFGRQAAGLKAKNSRPALTEFKVSKRFKNYTLLEVYPKTGRTHQIRTHLTSIGHPIVGDQLYSKKKSEPTGLTRQFLHAYFLKFTAPDGKILEFQSELPEDLARHLATLES